MDQDELDDSRQVALLLNMLFGAHALQGITVASAGHDHIGYRYRLTARNEDRIAGPRERALVVCMPMRWATMPRGVTSLSSEMVATFEAALIRLATFRRETTLEAEAAAIDRRIRALQLARVGLDEELAHDTRPRSDDERT